MKTWPILYTLDSKGKIRVFEIEVTELHKIAIVSRTGLLSGKLIEKLDFVTKGKQKRSVLEQAEFQAESLYKEKLDEGYKSIDMLRNRTGIDMSIQLASIESFLEKLFKNCPEAAYTNENWDELPQLAHKFKDIKKPEYPYFIQPKLNGVRCLIKKDKIACKLISRGGQYYQIPHLQEQLKQLYIFFLEAYGHTNFLFDGEIYKHGVPLQEISGAARKEVGDTLFASNSWLEYHIYDVINLNQLDEAQISRISKLTDKYHLPNIRFVSTQMVEKLEDVKQLHDIYISQGYEGAILRKPESKYEFNQRSRNLLKVKEYQDEEFEIIGCEIDENKTVGESFVFILRNNTNSLTFKSRPTGTSEQKQYWLDHPDEWENKKATVRFFERSNDGLPQQNSVQHKLTPMLIEHLRPKGE